MNKPECHVIINGLKHKVAGKRVYYYDGFEWIVSSKPVHFVMQQYNQLHLRNKRGVAKDYELDADMR